MNLLDKIKLLIARKYFKNNIKKYHYETLAPTGNSNSEETINMLADFLENNDNINIALSGKYGAGKSSILRTFFKKYNKNKYKPLYVSLGMFGINKNDEIKDYKLFCQEIEKSIIQQIIYREKPQDLPDSNIKRIKKMPKRSVVLMGFIVVLAIAIYLVSIYNINVGDKVKELIENIIKIKDSDIKLIKIILSYALIGMISTLSLVLVATILSLIWRKLIIRSYKIKLSNTEIEISEHSDESLISKYMNELIYFFSKTDYNVLVIEDLDRFLENENIKYKILIIFQKLKELSKILNDSKQINKSIKFIYAVKDDLFSSATERTKFFDAIIPVIPVVSNFNSYAELKDRFKDEKISDKEIQDISTYINDFRLIKNISNEYHLYKIELRKNKKESGITDEKIFSIIALKNIKPKLYEELQNDEGEIFELIKNRNKLYKELTLENEKEIQVNREKITKLQKEKIENLMELKRIAIGGLYGKTGQVVSNSPVTVDQFLEENLTLEYIKNNTIYIRSSNGRDFNEMQIFEYYDGKEGFIDRAETIQKKQDKEIERIRKINMQLEKQIKKIKELSLQEVLERINSEKLQEILEKSDSELEKRIKMINYIELQEPLEESDNKKIQEFLKMIKEKIKIDKFALMLVSNGYVDENYKNYMFYFKPTEDLNDHDYTYIINVRQSELTEFNYKINNSKEVIKQLDINYFGKKEILNYYILDELLQDNKISENEEKLNRLIEILLEINEYTQDFMFKFLMFTNNKALFLQKLYQLDSEYIKESILYNLGDENKFERIDYLIKTLLNNPLLLKNNVANECIREYIEEKTNFYNWIELNENVKESLKILNVKFKELENNNEQFIEFIYNNNLYILNTSMIKLIFIYKGFSEQEFEEKNFSIIMNNTNLKIMKEYIEKEKEEYIVNCYLKTVGTKNNIEDIINCLNNWQISNEIKEDIIKNITGKIEDIRDVDIDYYDKLVIHNKIKPTWGNYYYFYSENNNQITDELLHNMELNIEEIKKQRVSLITMPEDDKNNFINFRARIAKNNQMDINIYKQIIPICWINLGLISENEIEGERLKILVENRIIKFSNNNLQIIYKQVPEIIDVYINNNIEKFINEIDSCIVDENMICDIITSLKIKFKDKNKVLSAIDISYINTETMEYIINNYSPNKIRKISEKLKEKMFKSTLNISYKLTLLEKELDRDTPIDLIDNYLKLLPIPYRYISDYQNHPKAFSIFKTKNNEKILEKLENKGFNFTKIISKNRITIYNKK